jgi:hypothetical protein
VPNQYPGFTLPGFFLPSSGAFTLDLAKAFEKIEQDSTPKASHQPSPKDGVPPPVSHVPSAQGSKLSMPSTQNGFSSIGDYNVVPEKIFNQPPVSALWADQVNREEATCFPSITFSSEKDKAVCFPSVPVPGEADCFPSASVSDFHSSLYDADASQVTPPEWYCLSQGDARENLPEGFGHWDGKWTWLSLMGSHQHASQEMPMILRLLVMIQRWLSKAAKWDDFKVVDVGGHVVDLVATLKNSGNIHILLQNGQATNLESVLKIVLEGKRPFDAELVSFSPP